MKGYDARTKKHRVAYKDGDVKLLALRHEAVLIAEDSPVSPVASPAAAAHPASPAAASPAAAPPAENGKQAAAPGGDTPRSGRGVRRTPRSSGRKAAAAPKPASQPAVKTLAPEASPEPHADSSSSGSDSEGSQAAAPVLRRPNADRRRDRQRRRDSTGGGDATLNGVSKVSGSSAAKPRPDTKAGRAARRASGGKPVKAPGADDAVAEAGLNASQPSSAAAGAADAATAAAAAPVNGKRGRADDGSAVGSPPKVARVDVDVHLQQAPQPPSGPAQQPALVAQPQQQPPPQPQPSQQRNGPASASLPAQPQGSVSRTAAAIGNGATVGTPPNGVALGPVAAFKAALSGAAPTAMLAAQPRSQPQQPRNGLPNGKPHATQNGKQPQNGKQQQPPQQDQQQPPAVRMPPPPPVSTVGFSPKATTLQVPLHFGFSLQHYRSCADIVTLQVLRSVVSHAMH